MPNEPGNDYTVEALGSVGDSADATFTISSALTVSPASATPGGNTLAMATGFAASETVEFSFNNFATGASCTADATGDCQTAVEVPPTASTGPATFKATGETSTLSATAPFTVLSPPAIDLSTDSGSAGSTFNVTVSNFTPFEQVELYFGGTDTGMFCGTHGSGCTITGVTVPSDPTGPYTVEALGSVGDSAEATFTITSATGAPVVSAVAPNVGLNTGGTLVTITGSGFAAPVTVRFGGVMARHVTVVNGDTITAVSPPGLGTVNVRVNDGGGASALSDGDSFDYLARPTALSVVPKSGPLASGSVVVTIRGTAFVTGATVSFGAAAATDVVVVNATTITATAPAGSGTVDVRVTTPVGTSAPTGGARFTYLVQPVVTALTPASGPSSGGTPVKITGTGFVRGSTVKFGTTPALSVTYVNTNHLVAVAPAGTGVVDVTVTTPGGTSAIVSTDHFGYI